MAHILLGWELGGNRGHATTLLGIARVLERRGHRVSYALQRVDALSPVDIGDATLWPAPITPRLLVNASRPRRTGAHTIGDIMARLGFDDGRLVAAMVRAWRQLIDTIRPDLVIGDYAPFLLLAAHNRCPTINVGTGFGTPPSSLDTFPSMSGQPASFDEAATLAATNQGLVEAGLAPLQTLPAIFAASREIGGSFKELDPFSASRTEPLAAPVLSGALPPLSSGRGEEVFVYMPEQVRLDATLWQGLVRSGLPVRVHSSNVLPDHAAGLAALGLMIEQQPVPFELIAERSRLVVSHGGHGFVCSALLAGLPQVICHFDLEKMLYAHSVTRARLGGMVAMHKLEPEAFASSLVAVHRDDGLARRAKEAAPGFHSRCERPYQETVADAADALL